MEYIVLDKLNEVLQRLPQLLQDPSMWDSIVINKAKPVTYRVFTNYFGGANYRVCLHKFEKCSTLESFMHPHAWPAAFKLLKGSYELELDRSNGYSVLPDSIRREWRPCKDSHKIIMVSGSSYQMVHPLVWHKISPLEETYTVMINGDEYAKKHRKCRTTKGKGLDKMPKGDLLDFLEQFRRLV